MNDPKPETVVKYYLPARLFDLACIVISIIAGRVAIYELFMRVPNKIKIVPAQAQWVGHKVEFYLDTPTLAWLTVLLGITICLYYSALIIKTALLNRGKPILRKHRIWQIVGLFVVIVGVMKAIMDFANYAGSFG